MAMRGPRHPIGAASWIAEERMTALQISQSEVEEFMFSAKNEMDWLNEHMADIFSENHINLADIFKTPGKLRGKTPRTARKNANGDFRAPLTDVFSSTPKGAPNPFAVSKLTSLQQAQRRQSPTFTVAEDKPKAPRKSRSPPRVPAKAATAKTSKKAAQSEATAPAATLISTSVIPVPCIPQSAAAPPPPAHKRAVPAKAAKPAAPQPVVSTLVDSGYHGSQSQELTVVMDDGYDDEDELAGEVYSQPYSQQMRPETPEHAPRKVIAVQATTTTTLQRTITATIAVPAQVAPRASLRAQTPEDVTDRTDRQMTVDVSFHSAKEEQTSVVPAPVASPIIEEASSPIAVVEEIMSSSPFCPVQSPSSPVQTAMSSPPKPAPVSPVRKPVPTTHVPIPTPAPAQAVISVPVPTPSSPLQSTTPACPPPRELLSAMGMAAAPAPAFSNAQVPPAAPTPPTTSIPTFVAAKQAAMASPMAQPEQDAVAIFDEDADHKDDEDDTMDEDEEEEKDEENKDENAGDHADEIESDAVPSPVRPPMRKSSMNFASLPAREPFTSNKSMGVPATANPSRTSYYNRPTGGKSLGNMRPAEDDADNDDDDAMDADKDTSDDDNKTYAQRLHDRISMLGKSQANAPRPSKSLAATQQKVIQQLQHQQPQQPQQQPQVQFSPKRSATSVAAPGAFPEEDDDDDWILPQPSAATASPRLNMAKSLALASAAQLEPAAVLPKQRQQDVSRPASPKRMQAPVVPERLTSTVTAHTKSASVPSLPMVPDSVSPIKPISVSNPTNPVLAAVAQAAERPPTPSKSPSRNYRDSPLKHVKNKLSSILKTSKGLLASSAALSAEGKSSLLSPSSTRLGVHAGPSTDSLAYKSSIDAARPDLSRQTSATSAASGASATSAASGASATSASQDIFRTQESPVRSGSPTRPFRKTRASAERERRELKLREKELKEVQKMTEQMGKLEKMREKEREKARVFSEEKEKAAALAAAAQKPAQTPVQRELKVQKALPQAPQQQPQQSQQPPQKQQQQNMEWDDEDHEKDFDDDDMDMFAQPTLPKLKPQSSSPTRSAAKPTRSSPRKAKAPQADADADMADVLAPTTTSMLPPPPPSSTHSTVTANSSVPRSTQAPRTIRRPLKPTKEVAAKVKQAPTVIRVNTSSTQHQQQSSQFHPTNSALAASLHETLAGSSAQQHQLKSKASTTSLHAKPSLQSLKSSVSSSGRPKALEMAAKRKEAEEREAQRKRDTKAEIERKRAALLEQEEQRKLDLQKQRQAAIEKAKQTRAPPPAARTQLPSGPSGSESQPPRPQSRLATAAGSTMHRSQEDLHRPVNKALSKRPLPGDGNHESQSQNQNRPGTASGAAAGGNSNVPAYQSKDAKRIRMSEEFDENEMEAGGHAARVSSIKGPPVRPSHGFKKDLPVPGKSVFGNGYSTAPAATNVSRDLFKATVTAQHNSNHTQSHHHQQQQVRVGGHPMDMAQVSKAAISFAPSSNNGASSAAAAASAAASGAPMHNPHKTPLRPAGAAVGKSAVKSTVKSTVKSVSKSTAKSAAKSSPRVPNGEGIELPDIQTDDEDSDEDEHVNVAPWADSPDLRRALMRQETVDPFQVFGPPGPLNMEEVFNKSKDRWHKFRARTSSANWSGADRLTDDDIRKDLAARDKIRREGGWSYDLAGV